MVSPPACFNTVPHLVSGIISLDQPQISTWSSTMRYQLSFSVISVALLLFAGDVVIAQTAPSASPPSTALTKRALSHQDNQECTKQAAQQNIAKRNQADFVRKCMAARQTARKAAAKKEQSPMK